MKTVKFNVKSLLVIALTVICFQLSAQQTFKTTPSSPIGYLEYLPQGYNSNSNKYPLVIFLHGLGERGPNSTDIATLEDGISTITKHGPTKHVKNGTQFPFILVSPQLKNNYGDWPSSYIMEVLNHVKTYLRVDERRIYITGLSLGGGGTWVMAQDFTKLFAAVAPVCGSRNSTGKACNLATENLPVWAFHGDKDSTIPLSRSVNMVNAINACTAAPNPVAKMTTYAGVGHNAWDKAYTPDHTNHNPNVYEWMMSFTNTVNGGNKIPVANAGSDVTKTGSTLSLTGSATDADGTIASYAWTKMSGPAATLTNATSSTLSLSGLVTGTYIFRLRATDNGGESDSDYVKVTIEPGTTANVAPVANAGSDLNITLPTNSATINGTATDTDGTISSYSWSKVSGGAATLNGQNTANLSAGELSSGTYVFRLTVTDDDGATKTDDMNLVVSSSTSKTPPVVDAGADAIVRMPAYSVFFTGTASDSDGSIASYQWTQVSGPAVKLSDATTSKVKLSQFTTGAGTVVLRLTVTDNNGLTASDDKNVILNYNPAANAGADITVTLPVASVVINGTGSDEDGSITEYKWIKKSGPSVTMANASSASLTVSNLVEGSYSFRFSVKDNNNVEHVDYMTLTVLSSSGTARAVASTEQIEEESTEDSEKVETESEFLTLNEFDHDYWKNKTVVVFNQAGKRMYTGVWTAESHRDVFQSNGLYIYHVMAGHQKVSTGKIYISQ